MEDTVKKFLKRGRRGPRVFTERPSKFYLLEKMYDLEFIIYTSKDKHPLDKHCELLNLLTKGISQQGMHRVVDGNEYDDEKRGEKRTYKPLDLRKGK